LKNGRFLTRGAAASLLACGAAALGFASVSLAQQAGISPLGAPPASGPQSPLAFDDLVEYSIDRLAFQVDGQGSLRTTVMLGEREITLDLWPHSVRSAAFEVLVQQADGSFERMVPPATTTYRGVVKDMPGSTVSAGFFNGSLSAIVTLDEQAEDTWVVQPLTAGVAGADAALHVVHRESDDISAIGSFCGTVADPIGVLGQDAGAPGVDETLLLELAVDTDYEFFQLRGSEASVIAAVESQVNAVSNIYERDVDTVIEITTIIVRPDPADPYTVSDGGDLLNQMSNHWRSAHRGVHRDTASLISGRDFAGGVLGVAWIAGTCSTSTGYNVNQYRSLGTSARIAVHAHELGHNNNAPHCSGGDCRIMCPGIGGCSGDISRFGTTSRNIIRGFLNAVPCIDELVTEPDPQPLPFADNFDASRDLDVEKWAEASAIVITPSVVNPITAPNAVTLQPGGTLTTTRYDVPAPGVQPSYVSVWSQHRFVELGKFLRVEYFSTFNGEWTPLGAIQSDGTDQLQFVLNQWKLPLEASGAEFRLRIAAVGSDTADAWFIDSVSVDEYCRIDLNKDGDTNIFDFLAFQTAFDAGSPEADFTNDTVLNVFDFLEFQNQFGDGCD
jgi:hypothetical protein